MKSILLFVFLLILISIYSLTYKTNLSDISYPSILKDIDYKNCMFTIKYSANHPKDKNYGVYDEKSLSLFEVKKLTEKECECVGDALQFSAKKIQQFEYLDYPYFMVEEKNNTFEITIEIDDTLGTKMLNFNKIVQQNKNNLCKEWSY